MVRPAPKPNAEGEGGRGERRDDNEHVTFAVASRTVTCLEETSTICGRPVVGSTWLSEERALFA